ncbi:hypothetical protein MSAN_01878900 [Mycena sanguinolenta]|uniref:F-box domain-containing protein n=1 Tax=Mycena sanguinolenta TaxID=230812 RepID=A0A8H6XS57_9AGAR|nr:hypothetical protein MSAN_01878900 [Mycena sanguinolenta]
MRHGGHFSAQAVHIRIGPLTVYAVGLFNRGVTERCLVLSAQRFALTTMSLSNSPFADRLNTNYVPPPSEILEIRALLVEPSEEIARIDAQIEEMELVLAQLREKRALLQQPIDAHRALISPMRFIPHDVLLEIFFACLPFEHNALIDPAEAPLLLGRICRHWRSLAYSAPTLWSSIHIPPLDYHNTPPNILLGLQRFVEAWLGRSATCPLSVSLSDFSIGFDYTSKNHSLVLPILAVSRRLRYLTLDADVDFLRPILELGAEGFPLLKSIRINIRNQTQTISSNFFEIPTLEDVALCAALPTAPLSLPLPWSQLRKLRLSCWTQHDDAEGLNIDGALELLRRCPNLEWCDIRVTRHSQHLGLSHNQSSIILPHLHTLALSGWNLYLEKWIDLVAPNLRFLQIGDVRIPPNSQGSLSVVLDLTRLTRISIHQLLQSFPIISHLQLLASGPDYPWRISLDDGFMALLCPPHNLCPMLTDISFFPHSAEFSDAAALAFLKARMAMHTPLKRFHAEFSRPMEFDVIPELLSFISDGLQVTMHYPEPRWRFTARDGLEQVGLFH